jgi:GT2 family glycosyltransferase
MSRSDRLRLNTIFIANIMKNVNNHTAIVIPNWNGEDFLKKCLDSLLKQTIKSTIIIVENGSTDSSDEILASYGSKLVVLKQGKNLGFAGGVNVGIRHAIDNGYDYVALFNNDAVADTRWLEELVKAIEKDTAIGAVTCKFMRLDGTHLDSTGDFYTHHGLPFPRGRNEQDTGQYDDKQDIFAASGGATIFSVKMFKQIGLFDEDFFAYYEDVDLGFRMQLTGWKVRYCPTAIAYHHVSGTGGKMSGFGIYQTATNFWYTYIINMPSWLFWKYLPLAIYWYARMFAGRFIHGDIWPYIKGFFRAIWNTPKTLAKRRKVQKMRTATLQYIDSIIVHTKAPRPPKL